MAGERIVIARLEIQEDGAVRAIQSTQQSMVGLERQTKQSADIVSQRMFNARTATAAFLGTFTAAGAVLAFRAFITDVFKAASNFKAFDTAAGFAKKTILETTASVFGVNDALSGMTAWLERISGAFKLFQSSGAASKTGVIMQWLFGQTSVGQLMQIFGAAGQLIDKAMPGLRAAGKEPFIPRAMKLDQPPNLADTVRPFPDEQPWHLVQGMFEENTGDLREQAQAWRNLNEAMTEYGTIIEEDITTPTLEMQGILQRTGEKLEFWQNTLAAGVSLLGSAIANQGQTARQAIGQLFQTMSQMAFSFMAMHIAAAVGATTWLGMALTGGTVAQHKAAAAKWGVAGLLTGLAAHEFGKSGGHGGGSEGGAAGGGFESQSLAAQSRPVNVYFNIEGHMVGNQQFMRDATVWIKKALADGSAGGNL